MRAPFYLIDSIDCLFIEGIGPEPINGIGGEGDNPTLFEYRNSEFNLFFDRGCFGISGDPWQR